MLNMRKQYIVTTQYLTDKDERVVTLLGDIGVFSFNDIKRKHPNQVHNLGILEPASIGIAAGLARVGYIPFFHTIAPFVVERPFEQIKVDFAYQDLCGNFVSIGASYDDGALGMTHYCPGDIPLLKTVPNMEIVVPGTAREMDSLIRQAYDDGKPTYFRLSTKNNSKSNEVIFGKGNLIKKGERATIVVVGPMLDMVLEAVREMDVTVLYYTTVSPFDYKLLRENCNSRKILLCEPYYNGGLTNDVIVALGHYNLSIDYVGVPKEMLTTYGTPDEISRHYGITSQIIIEKTLKLINT